MKHPQRSRAPRQRPSPITAPPGPVANESVVVDLLPTGSAPTYDENDLVHDILHRVRTMFDLPADMVSQVEQGVRQDWGGERHYVARLGESARQIRGKRDQLIRDQFRRGEHVPLLARRWNISERHVRRIVYGDAASK